MDHVFFFPSEFLGKFPNLYKAAFVNMLICYHKAPNSFQQIQILQDFSSVFVLLPNFWGRMIHLKQNLLKNGIPLPPLFPLRKILTFSSKKYQTSNTLEWKIDYDAWLNCAALKEWNDFMYEPEKLLNFPHRDLPAAIGICKENSVRPIDNKVLLNCNRLCELYVQFIRDDLSINDWILNLNEINDEEVIIGLFEHRLGGKYGCFDKNLWKLYMDFLKDKDRHLEYLNLYRRYTRFFIEDKKMVEKYREEIKRISKIPMPVSEFWIDTIFYELDFNTTEAALEILKQALASAVPDQHYAKVEIHLMHFYCEQIRKADPIVKCENVEYVVKKLPISCYFPKNQIAVLKKTQNFAIPRTIIFYITQNIKFNHRFLKKLFKSCKYFFAIQPTPLCHRLVLGCKESSKYRDQSLFLNDKDLTFEGLDNLYITNTFDILSQDPTVYSKTIKRMYKCDSKYGLIDNQIFSLNEFEFIQNGFYSGGHMTAYDSKMVHQDEIYSYNGDLISKLLPKS